MPDIVNPPVEAVDVVLKALIYGVGVEAATSSAMKAIPFLALPIISTLFKYFVGKIGGMIYGALDKVVAFQIINFQTQAQTDAYNGAVTALKKAQASGDTNALDVAKDDFRKKLAALIHIDGD